tara:strand:+ start:197 stop:541 length:345 start_codon:yes stop_codon:yes gene_type:complete
MKCKIKENDGNLHVTVTIGPCKKYDTPIGVTTDQVKSWVSENHPKYKLGKVAKKGLVYNGAGPEKHSDTWIFELASHASGRAKPKITPTTAQATKPPAKDTTAKKTPKTRKRNS